MLRRPLPLLTCALVVAGLRTGTAAAHHYVNYDGATAAALPGGVPTLAIWPSTSDRITLQFHDYVG